MTADLSKLLVLSLTMLVCSVDVIGQANRKIGREVISVKPIPTASQKPLFAPTVITYATAAEVKAAGSSDKAATKTVPPPTPVPAKLTRAPSQLIKPILIVYRAYSSPFPAENSNRVKVKPTPIPSANDAIRKFSGNPRSTLAKRDEPEETTGDIVERALELSGVSPSMHSAALFDRSSNSSSNLMPVVVRTLSTTAEPIPKTPPSVRPPFGEGISILITASLDPIGTVISPPSLIRFDADIKEETLGRGGTAMVVDPAPGAVDVVELNNRAVQLTIADRYAEAEALLQKAIEVQPRVGKFHRNLSVLYEEMNLLDKALASARTAVDLSPDDPSVVERLCTIELDTHHWTEAVGCYEKLGSIQPLDAVSTSDYGMALLRAGKVKRSVQVLEKAAGSTPPVAIAVNSLGIAYFETKRFEDAATVFKRGVEIAPDRSEFHYNLAVAQLASRNRDGAVRQYNFLKANDPKLAAQLYQMLFSDMIVAAPKN